MENSSVTAGKFVCPKDFAEVVNTEGLCMEDIDEDCELFLIQTPLNVDLTKLHDQLLDLSKPTTFHCPAANDQEEIYNCVTEAVNSEFINTACLVLPERNTLKLRAVEKGIKGVIYIDKKITLPPLCKVQQLFKEVKVPKNLRKRAEPLSAGNSTVLSGDYDKKGATEDLPKAEDVSLQRIRKKKHNKHIIPEESPVEDVPVKSKKKDKQKRED